MVKRLYTWGMKKMAGLICITKLLLGWVALLLPKKCPVMHCDLFENPCLKLWLLFTNDQLQLLSKYTSSLLSVTMYHLPKWLCILMFWSTFLRSGETTSWQVKYGIYIGKWKSNLGQTQMFKWVLLKWSELQNSVW